MKNKLFIAALTFCGVVGLVGCSTGEGSQITEEHNHTLSYHEAVAGTCQTKGTIAYYSCAECGKKFSDSEGKNEITNIEGEYGAHVLGDEVPAKDATCTEDGNFAYQECTVCHKRFDEEGNEYANGNVTIESTGHSYKYVVTKAPTTEEEGTVRRTCTECDEEPKDFKVLPLPAISIEGKMMTVAPVTGATSYELIQGEDEVTLTLDDTGSFKITQAMLRASKLGVRAVTTDEDYIECGYTPIHFKAVGDNLEANTNWNYEANREASDLVVGGGTQWNVASPYGNFSSYDWYIVADGDNNTCAKIMAVVNGEGNNPVTLKKDLQGVNAAGKYYVKVDVKLSESANAMKDKLALGGNLSSSAGTVNGATTASLASCSTSAWTTVTFELDEKDTSTWTQVNLKVVVSQADLGSQTDVAIYVDNLKMVNDPASDENLDTLGGVGATTFETWDRMKAVNAAIGVSTNKVDWQFNSTIFVEASAAGYISIIDETPTNRAIKVYNPKECCEWDLVGNPVLKTAGVYKMMFDVKLGPDSCLRDLGLRAWSAGGQAIDDYPIDISSCKKGEWVTLEFDFTTNTVETSWINLFFWSFANNNILESFSLDNYFLFDNIRIYNTQLA